MIAVRTTCPYCGVGCGVVAKPDGRGGAAIEGDTEHPANRGRICSKGAALGETLSLEDRLLHPEIDGQRVAWNTALDTVADGFRDVIARHGPDAVAFYVSGQLLTEDYYAANKLIKGFLGTANIDTNSRLCMASSVAGHKRAFGSDTVPGLYEDFELADLVVLVGSNLAWCHPVLFQRLEAAKRDRPAMWRCSMVCWPSCNAAAPSRQISSRVTPAASGKRWSRLRRAISPTATCRRPISRPSSTGSPKPRGPSRSTHRASISRAPASTRSMR
jgi:anaerobic selenocysteine-containing dehydrogenase